MYLLGCINGRIFVQRVSLMGIPVKSCNPTIRRLSLPPSSGLDYNTTVTLLIAREELIEFNCYESFILFNIKLFEAIIICFHGNAIKGFSIL
jgi:hypothetical protein